MAQPRRIGLLGGSFNPAHRGHRLISQAALHRLRLDEVWWLVSPGNPLKSSAGLATLDERIEQARAVAEDPRIVVTGVERDLGTRYTIDTVEALKAKYPDHRFVWLMGADNLLQFPRWRRWRSLFRAVPIAVFPRPTYSRRALRGKAARRFARHRVHGNRAAALALMEPPAWIFLKTRQDAISATQIRAIRGAAWSNE